MDQYSGLPAHKTLAIKIDVADFKQTIRVLEKPQNFAEMFEDKLKTDIEALEKDVQESRIAGSHPMLDKSGRPNENKVRKRNTNEFQRLMDLQIETRRNRFKLAEHQKDTTRQWDLTAAAVEAAVIDFHGLTGTEAKRMRGRSKIRFRQNTCDPLDLNRVGDEDKEECLTKATWLKKSANNHSLLGNKLNTMAKRMHANVSNKGNRELYEENVATN